MMHSVVETLPYLAEAERLFNAEQRDAIVDLVANDPQCGVVISGTGGIRKVRVAASGRGKSGGARVIYLFGGDDIPTVSSWWCSPKMKINLSQAERNRLKTTTAALLKTYRGKQ